MWLENGFVASKSEMHLGQILHDDKNILHVFIIQDNNLCQIFCQSAGLKEGDYIVSVGGVDCKWLGVNEVLEKLKSVGKQPVEMEVISCQDTAASLVCKEANMFGTFDMLEFCHLPAFSSWLMFIFL